MYTKNILRETRASHSIVIKGSVPFLDQTYTGESAVMRGLDGTVTIPLCRLHLESELVSKSL